METLGLLVAFVWECVRMVAEFGNGGMRWEELFAGLLFANGLISG